MAKAETADNIDLLLDGEKGSHFPIDMIIADAGGRNVLDVLGGRTQPRAPKSSGK